MMVVRMMRRKASANTDMHSLSSANTNTRSTEVKYHIHLQYQVEYEEIFDNRQMV